MQSLLAIALKALPVHYILFHYLPLLFAYFFQVDVASLCHGLQHTLFLYFAKSTGVLIQLNYLISESE